MVSDKDLDEIRRTLTEMKQSIADDMAGIRGKVESELADMRNGLEKAQDKTSRVVTERPILSLGVAFLIGMSIGVALAKSRR